MHNNQPLSLTERIYRTRAADLLRYLRRRVRHEADARDIAQEAFLRFLRLEDPERLRTPEAYLFRIAGNLLWERRLRQQAVPEDEPAESLQAEADSPFDLAVANEETARLSSVVEALPALQRAIMVLHLREGLTFAEIAAQTGIGLSLAKKQYYKAVAACRERLFDLREDA